MISFKKAGRKDHTAKTHEPRLLDYALVSVAMLCLLAGIACVDVDMVVANNINHVSDLQPWQDIICLERLQAYGGHSWIASPLPAKRTCLPVGFPRNACTMAGGRQQVHQAAN